MQLIINTIIIILIKAGIINLKNNTPLQLLKLDQGIGKKIQI